MFKNTHQFIFYISNTNYRTDKNVTSAPLHRHANRNEIIERS